jgi:hypothetical protein
MLPGRAGWLAIMALIFNFATLAGGFMMLRQRAASEPVTELRRSPPAFIQWVVRLFFGPALGHGRAVEAGLSLALWLTAILLIGFPGAALSTKVTGDIFEAGNEIYLIVPVLCAANITALGLIFNIRGIRYSQALRITGALLGSAIWISFLAKTIAVGLGAAPIVAWLIVAIIGTLRVAVMAGANLPRPGAPGALGAS